MPKYLSTADVLKIEPKNRPRFADGGLVREPQPEPTKPASAPVPEPARHVAPEIVYVQPDVGGDMIVAAIKALGEKMPVATEPVRRVIETTFEVVKRDDDGRVKRFRVVEVIEK